MDDFLSLCSHSSYKWPLYNFLLLCSHSPHKWPLYRPLSFVMFPFSPQVATIQTIFFCYVPILPTIGHYTDHFLLLCSHSSYEWPLYRPLSFVMFPFFPQVATIQTTFFCYVPIQKSQTMAKANG